MCGCYPLVCVSQVTEALTLIKQVEDMLQTAASTKAH